MRTRLSIRALGEVFGCVPRVERHPKLGVYKYEVEYESKHETIGLTVLPIAGEVNVALFTKRPPRFIRLSLGDVSKIKVVREDEGQRGVEVHFANETVQTLTISLFPVVMMFWGNLRATEDDRPSWERD